MHLEVSNTMLHYCYDGKFNSKTLDIMRKNKYNECDIMLEVWHYNQQLHIIIYF